MFTLMKKIIFIPHLLLVILERYYKLAILGTLGEPGHTHTKSDNSNL